MHYYELDEDNEHWVDWLAEWIQIGGHSRLALGCREIRDVTSHFVAGLLRLAELAREAGGDLVLVAPSARLVEVQELLGLDQSWHVCRDRREAEDYFASLGENGPEST